MQVAVKSQSYPGCLSCRKLLLVLNRTACQGKGRNLEELSISTVSCARMKNHVGSAYKYQRNELLTLRHQDRLYPLAYMPQQDTWIFSSWEGAPVPGEGQSGPIAPLSQLRDLSHQEPSHVSVHSGADSDSAGWFSGCFVITSQHKELLRELQWGEAKIRPSKLLLC